MAVGGGAERIWEWMEQWGGGEEIQGQDKIRTWEKINGEGENNMA